MEKQAKPLDYARGKKIIIAITKSNFGGAQKYVYILAKTLKNKGFLVKVLLGGDGVLKQKLEENNIETLELKSLQRDISLFKEIKVLLELIKILKKEKPEVFHLNSSKIGILGAIIGRLMKVKKIIFIAHGFAFNENRNFLSKLILKIIYWKTFLFAHKTIFVSNKTMQQAPKYFLPKNKFEVIYNGIENIDFISKDEAKEILHKINSNLDLNKKWIGTLAELHHIKGIDLLINASNEILKIRNDIQFVVFGDGEEKEFLKNMINKLNLEKHFILFGQLEEASKYLKSLDLFVLPSRSEAMPLSILEAMQAQIPIIASNVGGISEMITQENLFEKENVSQLQKMIEEKINKLNNPDYNLEKFSLEKMIEKTIKNYN